MPVLTARQFKELGRDEIGKPTTITEAVKQARAQIEVKKEEGPRTIYVLLYPDGERSFLKIADIDGERITCEVVRGVLRTENEKLKDYLKSKGWMLFCEEQTGEQE